MAYAIRPMSVSEIVDTGVHLLRHHFGLLVGITASVYVPMALLQMWHAAIYGTPGRPAAPLQFAGILSLAVYVVVMALVNTALTMALCDLYVGRPTGVRPALWQASSILPQVVGTQLLMILFVGLAMVLLIVPGIWLTFVYFVISQVMVVERVFGMAALRRSGELMRGHKRRAAAIGLPLMAFSFAVGAGAGLGLRAWPMLQAVAPTVLGLFVGPLFTAIVVVFYFDVRCRHEAFDLEHLAQLVEQRGAALAPVL